MDKERRKVQLFTANQVAEVRSYLAQKTTEPTPQPDSCMIRDLVRAVFPELMKLRENGYSLNMLIRVLEEKGVRISSTALSGYLAKFARPVEDVPVRGARRERTQTSTSASQTRGHFVMKPDVTL